MPDVAKLDERYLDRPYTLAGRVIDPIAGTATYRERRFPLKRKDLEVLACLASAGTAIQSRDAFMDLVWQGNRLVGEQGLNTAIYAIRRALQDADAERPLIRTIPRRGYQLTAAAGDVEDKVQAAFTPGMPIAGKPGWQLSRRLGDNALSELWLAEEQASGEKRVFRFCRSEQHLQALRRETKVLRYLREALVGRRDTAVVLDWQLDEPPYHLEMDYASGGTLAEWAAEQGGIARVAYPERLRLMSEVADALAAVHAADVVHRNLGPSSVLIHADRDAQGLQACLGEFGLSDLTDRSRLAGLQITNTGLTWSGGPAGDALYLPPEVAAGGHATAAGDVYAFGVLLLQMASGDLQRSPRREDEASLASPPLRALIAACTSTAPEDRPEAAVVAERLRAFPQAASAAEPAELGATHAQASSASPEASAPAPARAADAPAPALWSANLPPPAVGDRIGPYQLLDQLGEGGMGTVYLAEQHAPVHRKVALKVVRTGQMSGDVCARFEAERQALALMQHANVATVFDAGSTPSGQPYFAMEYVQGQDITAHCDQLRLDFRARIALFLQVCEGVLHAHQKGLIHRDLKPGNILVSRAKGQPAAVKIIDFGVAKSMSGLLAANPAHTRLGSFVGTPAYSSPEQIAGPMASVDTRADIYSLGVVLYQLLAGVTPYSDDELSRKTPVELARLLSAEQPPSLLVRYASLSREEEQTIAERRSLSVEDIKAELGADLSWIVGKCLEVDPDDRYPTVLALENDLRRWLENLPVKARPASRLYRLRKFVRRHRWGVAAAALSTLMLLGTTTAAIVGYVRTGMALEAAEAATKKAEMAAEFQVKQMQSIDPAAMGAGMRDSLIEAVGKRGADAGLDSAAVADSQRQFEAMIRGLNFTDLALSQLNDYTTDPALSALRRDYGDQPLLQAQLMETLAETHTRLGQDEKALELVEAALATHRRLLGADHLSSIQSLARRGSVYRDIGKGQLALADMEQALKAARRVLGDKDPITSRIMAKTALTLGGSGAGTEVDALAQAERLAREALDNQRRALGNDHPHTLEALDALVVILVWNQKARQALPLAKELHERTSRIHREPEKKMAASERLAMVYNALGQNAESEAIMRQLVQESTNSLGSAHPVTMRHIGNLAFLLLAQGKPGDAESYAKKSLDIEESRYGAGTIQTYFAMSRLTSAYNDQGRLSEAEPIHRKMLATLQKEYGGDHPRTFTVLSNLARNLYEQGRNDEAVALVKTLIEGNQRVYGREVETTAHVLQTSAMVLRSKGQLAGSAAQYRQALVIRRRLLGDTAPDTLGAIAYIAEVIHAQGDSERAESLLRGLLDVHRRAGIDTPQKQAMLHTLNIFVQVLRARGKYDEAAALGQELTAGATDAYDARHYLIGVYLTNHARTLTALRRFEDAETTLDRAKANLAQGYNPNPEPVRELADAYIALYEAWNAERPGTRAKAKADAWRSRLAAANKAGTGRAAGVLAGS
jgi:eukaryotic-like serine/threonine-protein kinase